MAHLPHLHILSVHCRQLIHIEHHLSTLPTRMALLLLLLSLLLRRLLLSMLLRRLLPRRPRSFSGSAAAACCHAAPHVAGVWPPRQLLHKVFVVAHPLRHADLRMDRALGWGGGGAGQSNTAGGSCARTWRSQRKPRCALNIE